ncbi:hypothetical protein GCM10028822_03680 [Hymenobacter terrigena]
MFVRGAGFFALLVAADEQQLAFRRREQAGHEEEKGLKRAAKLPGTGTPAGPRQWSVGGGKTGHGSWCELPTAPVYRRPVEVGSDKLKEFYGAAEKRIAPEIRILGFGKCVFEAGRGREKQHVMLRYALLSRPRGYSSFHMATTGSPVPTR